MARPLFSLPRDRPLPNVVETPAGEFVDLDDREAVADVFIDWLVYWQGSSQKAVVNYERAWALPNQQEAAIGFFGVLLGCRQAVGHSLYAVALMMGESDRFPVNGHFTVDPAGLNITLRNATRGQLVTASQQILADVERYIEPACAGCDQTIIPVQPGRRYNSEFGVWQVWHRGTWVVEVPAVSSGGMGAVPFVVAAPFVVQIIGYTLTAVVAIAVARMSIDSLGQYFGINRKLQEQAAEIAQDSYDRQIELCEQIKDLTQRQECLARAVDTSLSTLAEINEDYSGDPMKVMTMLLAVGAIGLGAFAISKQ